MATATFSKSHGRLIWDDTGKLQGGRHLFRSITAWGCNKCGKQCAGHFGICQAGGCTGVPPKATCEAQARLQAWEDPNAKAKTKMGAAPYNGRSGGGTGNGAGGNKLPTETMAQLQARNKKLQADNKQLAASGGNPGGKHSSPKAPPLDSATKKLQLRLKKGNEMLQLWPNAKA